MGAGAFGAKGKPLAGPGTLSLMTPGNIATGSGNNPSSVYIPPDGKNVYASYTSGNIGQFARDVNTGQLTALSTAMVNGGYGPAQGAFNSAGTHLYVCSAGGDVVRFYTRNVSTGLLTYTAQYASGVYPWDIKVSADDKFVYLCNKSGASVSIYSRNLSTGVLTLAATQALTAGDQPLGVVLAPDANNSYLYVACGGNNVIRQFSRDVSTGLLTALTPGSIVSGNTPNIMGMATNTNGKANLYVANDAAPVSVGQLEQDPATGLLSLLSPATAFGGGGPWGIAITPDGTSVYCAASDAQVVVQHTRNVATGLLTQKVPVSVRADQSMSGFVGSGGVQKIAISPDGKHLYGSNSVPVNSIAQFVIHP